jgi:hypothetical protein
MDYFYDGQIRRYLTQFMRVFIGFKYKAGDGTLIHVPVMYGDMTRQVASIIKENSENKMPTVPRIACYISNIEMDMSRMSDATFVSKLNIRERNYDMIEGEPQYYNNQGGGYTVERLMPTPFKLTMKADIWTSNVEQKLQLFEQISVLFNPSLELQTTDNYIDWTSLTVLDLNNIQFTSRSIPAGAESEIDIMTMEFSTPIYISPPAKVKKLGVVRSIISNVFTEQGEIENLEDLIYNGQDGGVQQRVQYGRFGVLMLKSNNGQANDYDVQILNPAEAVTTLGLLPPVRHGDKLDWTSILDAYGGGYIAGVSVVYFLQPNGTELRGTFSVNELDPSYLVVTIEDKPSNTVIAGRTTVDAIVDPYNFNPKRPNKENTDQTISSGIRYLMLDDVNNSENVGQTYGETPYNNAYDGPDAWKNINGSDPVIKGNSIIEWDGAEWTTVFDPTTGAVPTYFQNLRTGIQYRWDGEQWLKSFEGEYGPGYWRFELAP